ncbi:MAG: intracellular sulfur oxidation DsrE/DsrF family protein [Clostridium sp.]|jgi:intracellular sulfur oxidation DsrE/DsrF family protein
MKKIVISLLILLNMLHANQKAVFDCAAEDMRFVHSRMSLIELTVKELQEKKIPYDFVLTIHSKCTQIVDKTNEDKLTKAIHKKLEALKKKHNVKIEVCGIAVDRLGYEKSELLPFVDVVTNSITRVIALQNDGYAFIPYH